MTELGSCYLPPVARLCLTEGCLRNKTLASRADAAAAGGRSGPRYSAAIVCGGILIPSAFATPAP
jgi:hypothetical protein